MEFGVLGPPRMGRDGGGTVPAGKLQRTLLAILLSRSGEVVSHDLLTESLWGKPGERGDANLHLAVYRLRRKLPEPDRLVSDPGGYRLIVLPGELDRERFETLLERGCELIADDPGQAAETLRAAHRLWRGEPYDGVDSAALQGDIHRLMEYRTVAVEKLFTAELAAQRHAEVLPELSEAVRNHPLNERLHALLMAALDQCGRRGDALAAYGHARRILVDELGQEPGSELRELEQRILGAEAVDAGAWTGRQPPAQLPGDVHGFIGRSAQLDTLDELIEPRVPAAASASVIVIVGTGGAGKSALALRWSHRVRDCFPDGQLYANLHGFGPDPPIAPEAVLGSFLRELGVDGRAMPVGSEERSARLRTLISERRILIVLDNAGSAEQVRPLLPGGSTCRVVITSRDSMAGLVAREGARRILLDRLPAAEAFGLFANLVGQRVHDDPAAAVELVERCARLPLAIRVAAEIINGSPGQRIGDLADDLADRDSVLDVLDAGGDESTAVRAVFSWSYRRLGPGAARAFRLMGLHPGYDVGLDAAAQQFGTTVTEARSLLRVLVRAHLLDDSGGRYRMHDLLRAYALDLCRSEDAITEQGAVLDRLIDHYVAFAEAAPERSRLDAERTNLVMVADYARQSGRDRVPIRLAAALRPYFKREGHHDQAVSIYEAARAAARQSGDATAEGNAERYLGSTYRRTGRLRASYEHMDAARHCFEGAGSGPDLLLQLINLGVTCTWLGRYDEAIAHLGRARELGAELGTGDPVGPGVLAYLGQAHFYRGEPQQALTYAVEACARPAERRNDDVLVDATAVAGLACERLERYSEARDHFERAWAIAESRRVTLSLTYTSPLALVYWHIGRRDDAYRHARHCLELAVSNGDRTMEPDVRLTLGELHRLAGSFDAALLEQRKALDLAASFVLPHQRARAELGSGDTLRAAGEVAAARDHWRAAWAIWTEIGSRYAQSAADRLAAP